ncbi:MAG TPA: phosphoenolpyruvate carboxykinase domain-containing protein [Mycobacteriales bacterium]
MGRGVPGDTLRPIPDLHGRADFRVPRCPPGDYLAHWIAIGKTPTRVEGASDLLPELVPRRDASGALLWPGFGENIRVVKWAVDRLEGTAAAVETPGGYVLAPGALDVSGLSLSRADLAAVTAVDADEWRAELAQIEEWFTTIGEQLPTGMRDELDALRLRLG